MVTIQKKQADLTVVLNIWKRNHIEEQIEVLLAQTKLPKHIWILQYGEQMSIPSHLKESPFLHFFSASINLKYFGRYSLAQHCQTAYTWILDDDIVPSSTWIETCESVCESRNAIVCSNGRIIPKNNFLPEKSRNVDYVKQHFIGDSQSLKGINLCEKDTVVDYGCSSFFFKTAWQKYFWHIWPQTFDTGEDMHLSATSKIMEGIVTIIPQQTSTHDSGNLKPAYSCDEHASYKKNDFIEKRAEVLSYLINRYKWVPILW